MQTREWAERGPNHFSGENGTGEQSVNVIFVRLARPALGRPHALLDGVRADLRALVDALVGPDVGSVAIRISAGSSTLLVV
jgi:hypothetical protein